MEENERLYEETQRRLREVTTLYEASQACLSISDQKGLLTAIIKAAARATDAALGSVVLIDEEKGEYIFGAHYGLSEETIAAIEAELHIPLGEGLVGSVVTTGQPLVVADVTTDPRWISVETKEPMHSFLGVPLVGRDGQPLGALTLSCPEVGALDEDHAKLLSTFANQAAMAIENARLYEQAQQEITERKQALEALRESEERYRRLVELSFEAIVIHREGKIVYINAAGVQLLGASRPEELIGKSILDFVHPDYWEIAKARVLQVVEEKLIRLDGTRVDVGVVGIPITYQGQPAVQVVIHDITERKRVEEALRESALQYRTTLDSMGDAIHVVDTDLRFTLFNTAFKQWNEELGLETDVIGQIVFEVFPFLPDKVRDEYRRVFDTGKTLITDERTKVGGREFITETRKIPVFEGGKVVRIVTVIRDITERKRAEEALRESEERFRQMAELSPFPVSIIDPDGRYEYVNPKFIEVFGYTLKDIPNGKGWFARAYPDPAYRQEAISTWLSDLGQFGEYRVRSRTFSVTCKDGTFREILFRPVTMKDGKQFIIYEDITERKRAEEALRESEEKYRTLFEQANDAVFLETLDGRILDVNEKACQLLGYERQELLHLTVADIVPPEVQEMLPQIIQEEIDRGGVRLEAENVRKDGSRVAVEVGTALLEIGGQNLVLALVRDITERKKLEEQLRQAQKMEAIGTLAGGIAHDFNNILTGILGFASVVHSELPPDNPLRPDVETIIRSAQRASELTRQLLTFARRGQVEVRPLSLNDVAREVIRLLKRTIDKAIAIEPYLASDLATVEGNVGQLQQMLLNLCLNARDAMPHGGQLIIETQNVTLSEEKAYIELDLEAGQYVLLSVTDTGSGMDAETQQRLFEPFFTTKEHGRGLGLAMVYGIVRGHGGTIHVYSEPGQGSTFKVYLPAASRPAEGTVLEEVEVVGGSETVLVIDDEEPVRVLLRRILEEGGYTVLLATDGVEAVELYTRLSTEIDLVVLDIIMPRMGGRETYERLREINPEVKVLLSSGYSENGQAQDILAAGAGGFLQKPYDLRAVLRKVREVLEG